MTELTLELQSHCDLLRQKGLFPILTAIQLRSCQGSSSVVEHMPHAVLSTTHRVKKNPDVFADSALFIPLMP